MNNDKTKSMLLMAIFTVALAFPAMMAFFPKSASASTTCCATSSDCGGTICCNRIFGGNCDPNDWRKGKWCVSDYTQCRNN